MGRAQRFEVTVEGRKHEVSVELDEGGHPVTIRVDDAPCSVQLGADDTMLVGTGEGPMHTVHLVPRRRPHQAMVDGTLMAVEVKSAREAALEAAMASAGGGTGGGRVAAPMPGRVVRLLVSEGDAVEHDAPLLIVEAMKMENEVRAPTAGTVRQVAVAAGDTVEAGQLLVEIAAPAAEA
ncbi:MAG: biotin/lipoyl-containing protein [Myxococcota bacterium]